MPVKANTSKRVPDLIDCVIVAMVVAVPSCVVLGVLAILLTGPWTPLLPLAVPGGLLVGIFSASKWSRRPSQHR